MTGVSNVRPDPGQCVFHGEKVPDYSEDGL